MEVQGGFRGAAPPPRKTRLREFDRFRYRGTRTAKAFWDRTYRSHKTYFESRSKDQETDTKKAGSCPHTKGVPSSAVLRDGTPQAVLKKCAATLAHGKTRTKKAGSCPTKKQESARCVAFFGSLRSSENSLRST